MNMLVMPIGPPQSCWGSQDECRWRDQGADLGQASPLYRAAGSREARACWPSHCGGRTPTGRLLVRQQVPVWPGDEIIRTG